MMGDKLTHHAKKPNQVKKFSYCLKGLSRGNGVAPFLGLNNIFLP